YFVGIDGARFKKPVTPGDKLMLEVSILANKRGLWKFAGRALVDGQLAAEAELLCTVREIE
ncbi:MAG: 3-hydroxyacyl-[acyl-carrier-protein] dehydratase FabZ, partial [Rhodocyclaceae bacterium]